MELRFKWIRSMISLNHVIYNDAHLNCAYFNCAVIRNRIALIMWYTGCPKKHGNSVTNSISSLLWFSIVIPNFKSYNIIMSARVYFMKRVKYCKDVSIMSPQDEQWIRTSLLCLYTAIFLFYYSTTICSQNINKQNVNIADQTLTDYSFLSR